MLRLQMIFKVVLREKSTFLCTFDGDFVFASARMLEQIDLDGDLANAALVWGVCDRKNRIKRAQRFCEQYD